MPLRRPSAPGDPLRLPFVDWSRDWQREWPFRLRGRVGFMQQDASGPARRAFPCVSPRRRSPCYARFTPSVCTRAHPVRAGAAKPRIRATPSAPMAGFPLPRCSPRVSTDPTGSLPSRVFFFRSTQRRRRFSRRPGRARSQCGRPRVGRIRRGGCAARSRRLPRPRHGAHRVLRPAAARAR